METIDQRIEKLREMMKEEELDALIIPSSDPHQSEYVSDNWKIRTYFSGFTGSAGTFVVTQNKAAIWTDSRYFLQAEKEIANSSVELKKQKVPHAPEHVEWVCGLLNHKSTIGVDFRLFSLGQIKYIDSISIKKQQSIEDVGDLICKCWPDRPDAPSDEIIDHPIAYCGLSREEKLAKVRSSIKESGGDAAFYTKLDEIAWLLNIRSFDVDYTPLVTAYVLVRSEDVILFVNSTRIGHELQTQLAAAGVVVNDYNGYELALAESTKGLKVLVDKGTVNYASYNAISGSLIEETSCIIELKSIKNEVEIANCKKGMIRDGVALSNFFFWLENYLQTNTITEYELGIKLESFRKEQKNYVYQSFPAIVGYKGNGAIVHYRAPEKGSSVIKNEGILLIDSGAQYWDATTDITRTIWLGGEIDTEIKKCYTLVLKGFIDLQMTSFPVGTAGIQLDAIARAPLWNHGYIYGHGTGHGVGLYGMVHESPQGFANNTTTSRGTYGHNAGQLSSIEPGCYVANKFGIRTENLVFSVEKETTSFGDFLEFDAVTLCYIDTQMIDFNLLTKDEVQWLNAYHEKVYDLLSPNLSAEVAAWLKEKCQAI